MISNTIIRPKLEIYSVSFAPSSRSFALPDHVVLNKLMLQVVEVSTSKTGKHGHAKCHFVAIDIFNGKKLEDIVPSSHNCDVSYES